MGVRCGTILTTRSFIYGRGTAKLRSGDKGGGEADIAAAKAIKADIADVYAGYGVE